MPPIGVSVSMAVSDLEGPNNSAAVAARGCAPVRSPRESPPRAPHRGTAPEPLADIFPAPALPPLDVEQLLGEVFSFHGSSPFGKLTRNGLRRRGIHHLRRRH